MNSTLSEIRSPIRSSIITLFAALVFAPLTAIADSGFYVGGSVGGATLEVDFGDTGIPDFPTEIDEDDTAYKLFAGYKFDLPGIDLGIEGGYVDFGKPDFGVEVADVAVDVELDPTGFNLWGIAGIDVGPFDLFAKLGYIFWDLEVDVPDVSVRESDDGSDIGYGVGVGFGLGPLLLRGEYEVYDIEDADLSMVSLGIAYQFN